MPPYLPSLPSFPSLPSVPSIRALLDPEPQLFYPAPRSPSRHRNRRDSASSTRSTSSANVAASPSRHARQGQLGRLEGASRSSVDLSGWETVENPLKELGRRNSASARPFYGESAPRITVYEEEDQLSDSSDGHMKLAPSSTTSPFKPAHRRSRSALPGPIAQRPNPAPLGRLHEFCRNPLASSSAVSLPTLAEGEAEEFHFHDAETPHIRTRLYRKLSNQAVILIPSPTSPTSPSSTSSFMGGLSKPVSPMSLNSEMGSDYFGEHAASAIDLTLQSHTDDIDITPQPKRKRPNDQPYLMLSPPFASSVPPPQRVARLRPPPSPRSYSDQEIPRQRTYSGLGLNHALTRSVSTGTSSVSDVAVLATWSFPDSPERSDTRSHTGGQSQSRERQISHGQPSDRLRERLSSLSMLDTAHDDQEKPARIECTPLSSSSKPNLSPGFNFPPSQPLVKAASTSGHRRQPLPRVQHRHTHSSPHTLPPPRPKMNVPFPTSSLSRQTSIGEGRPEVADPHEGSPGRPGHRRNRTTSRLRSPQPLSMPVDSSSSHNLSRVRSNQSRKTGRDAPEFAPLLSSDIKPLRLEETGHPLSRTHSAVEAHAPGGTDNMKGGWWRMRRSSVSGEISSTGRKGIYGDKEGMQEVQAVLVERREMREDSPENERFIDFDDM